MNFERMFEWSVAFIVGVFLVAFCGLGWFFWVGVFLCSCFSAVMLIKKVFRVRFFVCLVVVFVVGVLCFLVHDFCFRERALKLVGQNANVFAKVVDINRFAGGRKGYLLEVSRVNDKDLLLPVRVEVGDGKKFEFGCCDEIIATISLFAKRSGCSKFGFSSSRAKNVYLSGRVVEVEKIKQGKGLVASFFAVRDRLIKNIDSTMEEPSSFLASSIFLGRQQQIPYQLRRSFNHCGLSHIFAVSGLHVSILCAILLGCLRFLRVSNRLLLFVLFIFLLCYNFLLGFCPPALRASIMNLVYFFGVLFNRKINSVHLMFTSAAIILFFAPNAVFGCSFWLSFSSCLGILLFSRPISVLLRRRLCLFSGWQRFFVDLFAVSVSALVFSSIFLVLFFGEFSIVAPIVNLIIMPFVPVIFAMSGFVATFGSMPGFELISNFCGRFCEGIFNEILFVVKFFSSLPFAYLPMRYFFVPFVVFGLVGFLVFVFFYAKHLFFSKLVALLCCVIVIIPTLNNFLVLNGASVISVIKNGGKGHSIVITSSNRVVVLTCADSVGCEQNLCRFFDSRGIKKIDFLILMSSGLRRSNFDIETFVNCFETFCVMMPSWLKNEHLTKFLAKKRSYLIFQEQANYLNFPVSIDFLKSETTGQGFNCFIKIGRLSFAYCFSQQELVRIQNLVGFVNLAFLNDKFADLNELDEFDDKKRGYLVLLGGDDGRKFDGPKINSVCSTGDVEEFLIYGNYLKKEGP